MGRTNRTAARLDAPCVGDNQHRACSLQPVAAAAARRRAGHRSPSAAAIGAPLCGPRALRTSDPVTATLYGLDQCGDGPDYQRDCAGAAVNDTSEAERRSELRSLPPGERSEPSKRVCELR